ncbi:MAG: hypothetical protein ACREKL_06980, partial [Chthoniobacterales bacterium]
MWRLALLALAVLPGLATPARADIICDGRDYAFRDGVRDDVMARSIGQGIMLRMGMATFEGATYFACVKAPGNGVLLAPADSNLGNIPSLNPSLQTVIYSIPGDSGRNVTSEEVTYIVGLFVRDAQLYLVYMTRSVNDSRVPVRIEGNRIFVQPLRKSENSQKLERYGKRYTINPQDDSNDLNYATVVSGDDGIYIHALYSNGPKGNVYLRTYFLADAAKGEDKFVKLSSDEGLPPERAGQLFSPTACDAVGTHELNAQGQLEEVHYIMWASLDRHIVMCRYLPHDAGKGALAYTTTPTPIPSTMAPSQSTFTLVEGNLKGAPYNDFGITLIEVGRLNQILIDHRALFYSTDTHSFVGSWINVNFPFNHSGAGLKAGSVSHWGIDRTDMKPEDDPEHGPDGTSFRKAMHQVFHLASISYEEGSSQFISSTILGNRFVTDESLGKGNNNGFIDLNTSDAIGSKDASHFHAWTLIGVIHGVPPYVPYDKEHPAAFPNLKFTFSASIASSTGISDSTEDSK